MARTSAGNQRVAPGVQAVRPDRCSGWTMMDRLFFLLGALSAFVAVVAGAFGTHALGEALTPERLEVFETAARYQMYHALALLAVGSLARQRGCRATAAAGWLFAIGTVLFSGSLYALSLTGVRGLGAITPLGGAALLGGWLALAWAGARGGRVIGR